MTLYEIDAEISSCLDDETGEIIDFDKLSMLMIERSRKLEGVALWIKNLESNATAIRAERDTLDKRMKSAENKAKSLRVWLSNALSCQPFETARVQITFRKSVSAEVNTDILPKKWCTEKITYIPDKMKIKKAILAGEKIEGAELVEKQNIQIK
ncbi:MAG: siphovirus Gp157 family protein [Oscillospiraceae bacterium]|nr:siphovirus Gp157 family protein [Oscillospiraceae bacterium]